MLGAPLRSTWCGILPSLRRPQQGTQRPDFVHRHCLHVGGTDHAGRVFSLDGLGKQPLKLLPYVPLVPWVR